jgi:hypothetical protein
MHATEVELVRAEQRAQDAAPLPAHGVALTG